jgi:LacI family transcriptional regulator
MVTWPEDSLTGNIRLEGYIQALREAKIDYDPVYVIRAEYGEAVGHLVFDQLACLPASKQPTAYVTVSDRTAISLMSEAERRGLVVGKTVSVIGFDDEPMSRYLRPPLTSLRQPIQEISYEMIDIVGEILSGRTTETRQLLLPPELIVRESTGPLAQ